jgi:hypothetical protein
MTGISPERVAQHVRGSAVREGGRVIGDVDVACDGATLRITFTRQDAPSQVEQFRAVVAQGEDTPDPGEVLALRREVWRLRTRLQAAEALLAQIGAEQSPEVRTHLAGLYLSAQTEQGGDR